MPKTTHRYRRPDFDLKGFKHNQKGQPYLYCDPETCHHVIRLHPDEESHFCTSCHHPVFVDTKGRHHCLVPTCPSY